ncbi:MAG: glycerate kinase [Pontiellaceae bacterium]|nr:glycerate kinase [Pontiellaceae bacterium]MBN2784783.1 glycerate kinase [Pontiellaceae bacterium]
MKIVIAPDSFKGNMRSEKICAILDSAIRRELPAAELCSFPMADGGEGTVEAVVAATGGSIRSLQVCGPLGDPVDAIYGILPDGTAVMEMASASGIELVAPARLNPMEATTYGTGELLRHLLECGHSSIVMGIGGSATVDGGTGMAQALGFRFLDASGNEITDRGGKILSRIAAVIPAAVNANVRVACDVTNPLTGVSGAARVFGPQKGATPEMVDVLDAGLENLQSVLGGEGAPGDGAAGGLGYGLRAFCNAEIVSGAGLIAETVGLGRALDGADLLITGEGRTDGQTASGKLCAVLAGMARERGVKTLLLSGALKGNLDSFLDTFDFAFSISAGHTSLAACVEHAPDDLAFTVRNAIRLLSER